MLIVAVNVVYVSLTIAAEGKFSLKESIYTGQFKYIHLTGEAEEPTVNYKNELSKLFKKVEKDEKGKFWLKDTEQTETSITIDSNKFLADTTDSWAKKNTLFYDIRVTLALYLNYIKVQSVKAESEKEDGGAGADLAAVPFSWVDWIDLTDLNTELSLPISDRTHCKWFKSHVTPSRSNYKDSKCRDSEDIPQEEFLKMGFRSKDQIPGYVIDAFSLDRGTIDARIMQANSYKMTNLPIPYKLLFLNQDNGTYEVNIDQSFPRKRLAESDLMKSYLTDKKLLKLESGPKKLKLDPVKEFKELKKVVLPTKLQEEEDLHKLYKITHSHNGLSKTLPIEKEAFHYGHGEIHSQLVEYTKKSDVRELNFIEKLYVESLLLSKERNTDTEHVYFRQATLWHDKDPKNKDQDRGYHYDWRFFVGTLTNYKQDWTAEEMTLRQEVILDRMARSWFRFAEEKGFVSWIMHGPLLSWYWDGLMFPFDDDLDIQMPARELARLGELYNQTLVIEDVEEGFGKYLIDIGTYVHNRDISRRENHIDARFIDVDSGMYIDITGLSVSPAKVPDEFENDKELLRISKTSEFKDDEIYNDRRKHFYKHGQLSPLRYSQLGGVPLFIPNDITKRLSFEYPKGVTSPEFNGWYYIPQLAMWVHKDELHAAFDDNDFRIISTKQEEHGKIDGNKLNQLILDMEEEHVLQLLHRDSDILCEYYKTKEITSIHEVESKFLFGQKTKEDGKTVVEDRLLSGKEYDDYSAFVNNKIKMSKPLRKSYFQYHYIDQPKHHQEFLDKAAELKKKNN